jgi:hypothetical protein
LLEYAGRHNVPHIMVPRIWRRIAARWHGSDCDCRF